MGVPAAVLMKVHSDFQRSNLPQIKSGMTIKVHQKIKEGAKERIQAYEGLVIAISSGNGIEKTMTVRKVVDSIGVEKVFPIHSTNIKRIDVVKQAKVRRAKLYYLRDRQGKAARLKEIYLNLKGKDLDKKEEKVQFEEVVENKDSDLQKMNVAEDQNSESDKAGELAAESTTVADEAKVNESNVAEGSDQETEKKD